jgi:hypothetical protein
LCIKFVNTSYYLNAKNLKYFFNLTVFTNKFVCKASTKKYLTNNLIYFNKNNTKTSLYVNKSFLTYLRLNISTQSLSLKPHYSFKSFFLRNTFNGSVVILSVNKFYNKYNNVLHLMTNLFHYNFLL